MTVYNLILKRRTIRKFENRPIEKEKIIKMVNAARVAPSGANLQPLKYIAVTTPELCEKVFPLTRYAAYLKDGAPKEGEKPMAYIVVLEDESIRKGADLDAGAAIENLILTALEDGIASCWIGSVDRDSLRNVLGLNERFKINSVIALGYPAQQSEEAEFQGDVKYYLDGEGKLHVPKRGVDEILNIL